MKKRILNWNFIQSRLLVALLSTSLFLTSCTSEEADVNAEPTKENQNVAGKVSLDVKDDEDFSDRVKRSKDTWSFKLNDGDSRPRGSNPSDLIARAEAFTSPFNEGEHTFDAKYDLSGIPDLDLQITIAQLFANCKNCGSKAGPQLRVERAKDGEIRLGSRSVGNVKTGIFSDNPRITITTKLDKNNKKGKFTVKVDNKTFIDNADFDANGTQDLRASFRFGLYYNDPAPKNIKSSAVVSTLN